VGVGDGVGTGVGVGAGIPESTGPTFTGLGTQPDWMSHCIEPTALLYQVARLIVPKFSTLPHGRQ
jgi:hypothetical protein